MEFRKNSQRCKIWNWKICSSSSYKTSRCDE